MDLYGPMTYLHRCLRISGSVWTHEALVNSHAGQSQPATSAQVSSPIQEAEEEDLKEEPKETKVAGATGMAMVR